MRAVHRPSDQMQGSHLVGTCKLLARASPTLSCYQIWNPVQAVLIGPNIDSKLGVWGLGERDAEPQQCLNPSGTLSLAVSILVSVVSKKQA
jgi:hypothetical protein